MAPKGTPQDTQEDDAMPQSMADEAMASASDNEEWEDVKVGLGTSWDIEKTPLQGVYIGMQDVEIKDDPERTSASAFQFDTGNDIVFIWESHELSVAMDEVGIGEKVRITYTGREQFTDKTTGKPRQVKRYRVQRAVTRAS